MIKYLALCVQVKFGIRNQKSKPAKIIEKVSNKEKAADGSAA